MSIRILLADDHAIIRHGVRQLLEAEGGLEVVGEAGDGREAVAKARKLRPDVVVIDITMPNMNGVIAMRQILKVSPGTKVLVLSMHADEQFVAQALKAGASGYVEKGANLAELVGAIKAVASGKSYLSGDITTVVVDAYARREGAGPDGQVISPLSPREEEIVQLLAEGKASKAIAYELGISVRTVDVHRQHIMKKLSLDSVAALVKWAIRHGLTSDEG
ncbi:MAG: response regulator [Planctomycetota bacterium]